MQRLLFILCFLFVVFTRTKLFSEQTINRDGVVRFYRLGIFRIKCFPKTFHRCRLSRLARSWVVLPALWMAMTRSDDKKRKLKSGDSESLYTTWTRNWSAPPANKALVVASSITSKSVELGFPFSVSWASWISWNTTLSNMLLMRCLNSHYSSFQDLHELYGVHRRESNGTNRLTNCWASTHGAFLVDTLILRFVFYMTIEGFLR